MSDAVHIEAAAELDLDTCRRLVLGSEPWITLGYGEEDVQATVRAAPTGRILIARDGERIVGFALSTPGVLLGEYLKILTVDAAFRGRGVGARLMAALEAAAFQRWPNVYLCVTDFNTTARRFYRRLGYAEIGALPDLLVTGSAEILMRKTRGPLRPA